MTGGDAQAERAILELLDQRRPGSSICPSEAARRLSAEDWRSRMPDVHAAVRSLASRGEVWVKQAGRVVDSDEMRGPIRIARRRRGST